MKVKVWFSSSFFVFAYIGMASCDFFLAYKKQEGKSSRERKNYFGFFFFCSLLLSLEFLSFLFFSSPSFSKHVFSLLGLIWFPKVC